MNQEASNSAGSTTGGTADSEPIRGVDHIGITVPDMEAASAFFEAAFGAEFVYEVLGPDQPPQEGEQAERQLGIPPRGRIVRIRLLQFPSGPGVELFETENTPHESPAKITDYGLQHLALYTDDIHASAKLFERAGGTLLSEPHALAGMESGEGNMGVYARTPWGMVIELIAYPSGIQYPAGIRTTRFTPPAVE